MSANPGSDAGSSDWRTSGAFKTFRALRHRDFRLLWVGLAVSAIGTWMQIVAQSLLVLKVTQGSALALGTVSLAQALAFFFFALVGGSVADRMDFLLLRNPTQCLEGNATSKPSRRGEAVEDYNGQCAAQVRGTYPGRARTRVGRRLSRSPI